LTIPYPHMSKFETVAYALLWVKCLALAFSGYRGIGMNLASLSLSLSHRSKAFHEIPRTLSFLNTVLLFPHVNANTGISYAVFFFITAY
jgi:hypothetical protein